MKSPLLRSDMRVLDAGCGTGAVLLALREALGTRGLVHGPFHGFDITPAMLDLLQDLAVDLDNESDEDNPLRQVIINTHSPEVAALVLTAEIERQPALGEVEAGLFERGPQFPRA